MKYVYEIQTYYSGWWQHSLFTSKEKAVAHAKRMTYISIRVVRHSINTGKLENVTVWDKQDSTIAKYK